MNMQGGGGMHVVAKHDKTVFHQEEKKHAWCQKWSRKASNDAS
jgi:hypothetical protein